MRDSVPGGPDRSEILRERAIRCTGQIHNRAWLKGARFLKRHTLPTSSNRKRNGPRRWACGWHCFAIRNHNTSASFPMPSFPTNNALYTRTKFRVTAAQEMILLHARGKSYPFARKVQPGCFEQNLAGQCRNSLTSFRPVFRHV